MHEHKYLNRFLIVDIHLTQSLPDKQISKPGAILGTDSFSDDGDEIDPA